MHPAIHSRNFDLLLFIDFNHLGLIKQIEMIASLTPREKQIANLILAEKSNASIATELSISERTVETHRKSIYNKTGAKTVVGLVKMLLKK
jgi:DNA-binding CsgD family transcriptional regulator